MFDVLVKDSYPKTKKKLKTINFFVTMQETYIINRNRTKRHQSNYSMLAYTNFF